MSKCPDPTNCGANGKCGEEDPVPDPYDEGHLCKDCGVWEDPTEPHNHWDPVPERGAGQTEGYLAEIKRQGDEGTQCASGCGCDEKGAMHEGPCVFNPILTPPECYLGAEPRQRLMPLGAEANDYPNFLPDEVAWLAARGYERINRNAPKATAKEVRMHSNGALGCFNIMDMMEGQKVSLCAEVERLKTKLGDVCEMGVIDSARADSAEKALATNIKECERLTARDSNKMNEKPDVMDPDFWKSKTHLVAVIDELERANNMPIRPKGGQQVGMDESWDLAHNRIRSKREINWSIREIRMVINEHFKEKD